MMRMVKYAVAGALLLASTASGAESTDGKNRKILVQNISSQAIRELYASPVTAKTWEEDLLGQRTLGPNQSISANIDNGTNECNYDLKAVRANGSEVTERGVNVCAKSKWAIGDTGDSLS
ncbi:MAG: hypothetical protein JWR80_4003 [Bradyrhizobium sp.]|jgi:hypothetical protein|nr:hypothetical protein [Bradyrhizobium sp.]